MPNTCTVYGCRSGYRLNKKEKLQMDRNENIVHQPIPVHKFPVAHVKVCEKWKQVLSSFMDISHITNFAKVGVCKLHFKDSDYAYGKTQRGVARRRNRLKADAVPSVFPVAPSYMQKKMQKRETHMAAPSARLDSLRDEALAQEKQMLKDLCVCTLDKLAAKLKDYRVPAGFEQVMYRPTDEDALMCFHQVQMLDYQPVVQASLVIDKNMKFKVYKKGAAVNHNIFKDLVVKLRKDKTAKITKVDEVVNVLSRLNDLKIGDVSDLDKVDRCLDELNKDKLNDNTRNLVALFQEQLKVTRAAPKARKYPTHLLMKCVTWARMGPKLYRDFVNNSGLTLPSYDYIRRFTHFTKFRGDVDDISVKYFKMRIDKLEDKDKVLHMAIDEVYTTQSLSLVGGTFFGETDGCLTRTLLSVHINSVAGSYEVKVIVMIYSKN